MKPRAHLPLALLTALLLAAVASPALAAPRLVLEPSSLSFDRPGQAATVAVRNVGDASLAIDGVSLFSPPSAKTSDFALDPVPGRALAPGDSFHVQVRWVPSDASPARAFAALIVRCDDPLLRADPARPNRYVGSVALRAGTGFPLLSAIVFFPLLGIPFVLAVPRRRAAAARWVALAFTAVPFALAIHLATRFDPSVSLASGQDGLQFVEHLVWIRGLNVEYFLGVDGLSIAMVVLSALVSLVAVGASWSIAPTAHLRGYFALFLLLEVGMMGVFVALDFFLFFVFWEVMLLPMYFLIGLWGGPRREYAAIKFFLYTLAGGVMMLLALIALYYTSGATYLVDGTPARHTFDLMKLAHANDFGGAAPILGFAFPRLVWVLLFVAFAIKVPVVPFHTWLPDAHVEAPTAVSVVLAGVLLKMGTYGLLRVNFAVLPEATRWAADFLALAGTVSIVWGALCAMAQTDLKRLVAYSSVSHMGYCLLGMAALTPYGTTGAIVQMFNHGTITSMLFLLVGVLYDRAHTRGLDEFGGLARVMPRYAAMFGLAFMASLGLPGLSGFIGEALVFLGAFNVYTVLTLIAGVALVLTAAYHLGAIQRIQLGAFNERWRDVLPGRDLTLREWATLLPLAVLVLVLGFWPMPLVSAVEHGVEDLLAGVARGAVRLGALVP